MMLSIARTLKKLHEEISQPLRSTTFYHGTKSFAKAEGILKNGLDPAQTIVKYGDKRPHMRPLDNHVYITPNLAYAVIYALGGDIAGTNFFQGHGKSWIEREGKYGFVFEINGADLVAAKPDEDLVGEIASAALNNSFGYAGRGINWKTLEPVMPTIANVASRSFSSSTLKKLRDGDYSWMAKVGKSLVKKLPEDVLNTIMNAGASLAHEGALRVSGCWRFDKELNDRLAKDCSNFFELAEKIA